MVIQTCAVKRGLTLIHKRLCSKESTTPALAVMKTLQFNGWAKPFATKRQRLIPAGDTRFVARAYPAFVFFSLL